MKRQIGTFLHDALKLTLSEEKTLITHARTEAARFLSYHISTMQANTYRPHGKRYVNGKVELRIPEDVLKQKCERYLKNGKPIHRKERETETSSPERPAPERPKRETTMDAGDGLSTTKNVDRLLVVPNGHPTWKTTQDSQKQKQCVTGEPDTWKLGRWRFYAEEGLARKPVQVVKPPGARAENHCASTPWEKRAPSY